MQNLETLQQEQPGQRFSWFETMTLMAPIIYAVSYLHRQRPAIIHGNIKPANIIVPQTGDRAILVDPATVQEHDPGSTTIAAHSCSPGYKAPEQYSHGVLDTRTDVYGLGATFYTLLTDIVPPDGFSRLKLVINGEADPLQPINEVLPTIPALIVKAVHQAMSLDTAQRFSSIEQFWEMLWEAVLNPEPMADKADKRSEGVGTLSEARSSRGSRRRLSIIEASFNNSFASEGWGGTETLSEACGALSILAPAAQSEAETVEARFITPLGQNDPVGADLSRPSPMYEPIEQDDLAEARFIATIADLSRPPPMYEPIEQDDPVGADSSCPPPIYRPTGQDDLAVHNDTQPVGPDLPYSSPMHEPIEQDVAIGADSSCPPPIDQPTGHPPYAQINVLKLIVLGLLISLGIATVLGILSYASSHTHPHSYPHPVTPTANISSPTPAPTSTPASTINSTTTGTYNGTMYDLTTNVTTSLSLTDVQQSQGKISGYLIVGAKLQGSGPFRGTIDATGHLQFTVTDAAGHAILFFEGALQSATSLSGDYYSCSQVQAQQCSRASGDYGIWSAIQA